jgi:hypothetical protein
MFFMMGITDGRKDFDFVQTVICDVCGKYGRYQVFMTYTVLSLFLIPCFKWNRRYYVQTSCCGTLYELDPEIGKAIARGEQIEILPQHLRLVNQGGYSRGVKRCSNCGYETAEDFEFCPKCGMRF